MTEHVCRVCGTLLVIGKNVTQYRIDTSKYICQSCNRDYQREYQRKHREYQREYQRDYRQKHRGQNREYLRDYMHRTGRNQPMSKKRDCPAFLGIHVAERVLSHIFKNVTRMPYNNPGYDFVCNNGFLVDAKAACRGHHLHRSDNWTFHIHKNQIAQYFICLAFNNREDLTPEHIWLIPAGDINDKVGVSIADSRIDRWSRYELPINQVVSCCDTIR